MKFAKITLLALTFPAFRQTLNAWDAVIFDPINVLFEVDTISFGADVVGIFSGLTYAMFGGDTGKLKEKIFAILNSTNAQAAGAHETLVRDPEGTVLPQILCDFLSDKAKARETAKKAIAQIEVGTKEGKEQDIMKDITRAVFNPKKLAYHTKVIGKGIAVLEESAKRYGKDKLFILANFNKDTILTLLGEKHIQPMSKHFINTNIFVSGIMQELLPNKGCFEKFLKQRNFNPQQCVFITAMPYHAQAARELGFKTVFIQDKDFKKSRAELKALGIL